VLSIWNHYTPEATAEARGADVGIFEPREFMSARHRNGHNFLGE
jgi:hypothetical protein